MLSGGLSQSLGSFAQSELGRTEVIGVEPWAEIRRLRFVNRRLVAARDSPADGLPPRHDPQRRWLAPARPSIAASRHGPSSICSRMRSAGCCARIRRLPGVQGPELSSRWAAGHLSRVRLPAAQIRGRDELRPVSRSLPGRSRTRATSSAGESSRAPASGSRASFGGRYRYVADARRQRTRRDQTTRERPFVAVRRAGRQDLFAPRLLGRCHRDGPARIGARRGMTATRPIAHSAGWLRHRDTAVTRIVPDPRPPAACPATPGGQLTEQAITVERRRCYADRGGRIGSRYSGNRLALSYGECQCLPSRVPIGGCVL